MSSRSKVKLRLSPLFKSVYNFADAVIQNIIYRRFRQISRAIIETTRPDLLEKQTLNCTERRRHRWAQSNAHKLPLCIYYHHLCLLVFFHVLVCSCCCHACLKSFNARRSHDSCFWSYDPALTREQIALESHWRHPRAQNTAVNPMSWKSTFTFQIFEKNENLWFSGSDLFGNFSKNYQNFPCTLPCELFRNGFWLGPRLKTPTNKKLQPKWAITLSGRKLLGSPNFQVMSSGFEKKTTRDRSLFSCERRRIPETLVPLVVFLAFVVQTLWPKINKPISEFSWELAHLHMCKIYHNFLPFKFNIFTWNLVGCGKAPKKTYSAGFKCFVGQLKGKLILQLSKKSKNNPKI